MSKNEQRQERTPKKNWRGDFFERVRARAQQIIPGTDTHDLNAMVLLFSEVISYSEKELL